MNGISRLLIAIVLCFFSSFGFSQKDTSKTKTGEADLFKSACKLMDSAKYKDAIVLLKKAVKIKPDYYEAFNKMALAKLKTEDYKGAEKDLQAALKIFPDNFESQKTMGILYYETKKYKEAKATLDSAAALNSDDAELFYYQAKLMYDGKAYKNALDACARALDLNAKYIDVIFLKGEVRFAMKDYAYCVKELTEAIKLMPADNPNYNAYKTRAKARFELADYKNAVNDWNVYLEAFPEEETALVARGACKIETRDNTGAIVDFDAGIQCHYHIL